MAFAGQEIIILDDDFGQPEELVARDPQLIEEAFALVEASQSVDAMNSLSDLAYKDKNRALMRQLGLTSILCSINSSATAPLNEKQVAALRLLSLVLQNLPTREEVRKKGGVEGIINLAGNLKNEEHLGYTFLALSYLADNPRNRTLLRQRGVIDVVASHCKSPNVQVLKPIFLLLATLSLNEKKTQDLVAKHSTIIAAVMKGIENNDGELKRAAVTAIGALSSKNRKIQGLARKSKPGMALIAGLLIDPISENREMGAIAILQLAEGDFSNQVAFFKLGVVDSIADILKNPNESLVVKEKVCAALVALGNGNSSVQKGFNDFPALVECTMLPAPNTQAQALYAIAELCSSNSSNADKSINAGFLDALVITLQSDSEAVQYRSANALYSIVRKNPSRREIVMGVPDIIMTLKLLKTSGDPKVKQGAEWCLEEL